MFHTIGDLMKSALVYIQLFKIKVADFNVACIVCLKCWYGECF